MTFRSLSKSDVSLISELYKKDFADGWKESLLNSAFDGGRFISFGAFDGKELIGVITVSVGIDDADVEGVVVSSEYRKNGVAKMLISEVLNELTNRGVFKVLLEVRESNEPAKNLYRSVGFNVISVRKKYYNDGENALVMLKELIG